MGKCSVCGNKILYNAFKKIKGVIYCLKCVPKEDVKIIIDEAIDVDFDKLQAAMKEPGILIADKELAKQLGEPMEMSVTPIKVKNSKRKKKVGKHKKTSIKKGRNTAVGYDTLYDDTVIEIKEK